MARGRTVSQLVRRVEVGGGSSRAPDQLVVEARTNRLLPGAGGLDLRGLVAALPADIAYGVEVPLAGQFPDLAPVARLRLMVEKTREFLRGVADDA